MRKSIEAKEMLVLVFDTVCATLLSELGITLFLGVMKYQEDVAPHLHVPNENVETRFSSFHESVVVDAAVDSRSMQS